MRIHVGSINCVFIVKSKRHNNLLLYVVLFILSNSSLCSESSHIQIFVLEIDLFIISILCKYSQIFLGQYAARCQGIRRVVAKYFVCDMNNIKY